MNKTNLDRRKKLRLPEWTPSWLRVIFRVGFRISIIFTLFFLITALYYYYLATQYDPDKVAEITEPSLILAEDGSKLAAIGTDTLSPVAYAELPPHLIDSLLAREDSRFRDHIGIDVIGLARAMLKNLTTMSYQEGASTISMQLVKNTYNNKSKSIHRKLLEIAITLRIESRYNKDQILTHYLNRIYFGSGCHGIEEAANTYFGVTTRQLTLGQSALLVGIIRGPHIFSPFNDLESAITQRDQVLDRLYNTGKITSQEKEKAREAPLKLVDQQKQKPTSSYAVSSIRRHQQQIIDTSKIREGGLRITSTIDKKLSSLITRDIKKISTSFKENQENTPLQVAVVVLENQTGAIRTIIGGTDYLKYPYNRALDSKQELGPAFTPLIYLAALDRGKLPLRDKPVITGQQIGTKDLLGYCNRFEINHKPNKNANDLFRGSIYASPLQLANAYTIIQNGGTLAESYFIETISNKSGDKLFIQQHYKKEVVSAGAALSCRNMLIKANKTPTPDKQTILITACAYKHAWIIASNNTHTAVVWLGHDLPEDIPNKQQHTKTLTKNIQHWLKSIQSP